MSWIITLGPSLIVTDEPGLLIQTCLAAGTGPTICNPWQYQVADQQKDQIGAWSVAQFPLEIGIASYPHSHDGSEPEVATPM